jgi:hypothetical protein
MDLATTFGLQVGGQIDVVGTGTGSLGAVAKTGWDYGSAVLGTSNDYMIADVLTGTTMLTASVNWLRNRYFDYATTDYADVAQANLNLSVWLLDESNAFTTLIARSESLYNTVEHLSFLVPRSGRYGLRVEYPVNTFDNTAGDVWGSPTYPQDYAVSWSAVPEPSLAATTLAAVAIAAMSSRARCGRVFGPSFFFVIQPRRERRRPHQFASTARPPRSAIGSGTTRTSIPAKCVSVMLTARELAQARYQPRNTCDG